MKTIAIAALVLAAIAASPSFAASRTHADTNAYRYESLVQRDAAPALFQQDKHQGRTINAWGHSFTVE